MASEIASHKLLLHDATRSMHYAALHRRKYMRKIVCLTIIIILLTNLLSIVLTGSITYFLTNEQETQAKVPEEAMTPSSMGLIQAVSRLKAPMEEQGESSTEGVWRVSVRGETSQGTKTSRGTKTSQGTNTSQGTKGMPMGNIWICN